MRKSGKHSGSFFNMGHIVLLGDSIFDNERYVPDKPPIIEQLRRNLPTDWQASLLAVDGHITDDVVAQLAHLPADTTHLFVSVGGNDALGAAGVLHEEVRSVGEALLLLHQVQSRFRDTYQEMLRLRAGRWEADHGLHYLRCGSQAQPGGKNRPGRLQ